MAKRIKWSKKAASEKRDILEYWYKKTGNKKYSQTLSNEIHEVLNYISQHNYLGRSTDFENVHVSICRGYLIFYEVTETINVLAVWDNRRNPEDLKIK